MSREPGDFELLLSSARFANVCRKLWNVRFSANLVQCARMAGGGHRWVEVAPQQEHLLCPRGVAFMWVAPEHQTRLAPYSASWRSTRPLYASYYGGHLDDLAPGAARFDLSLAWHSWVGARESLRFLLEIPRRSAIMVLGLLRISRSRSGSSRRGPRCWGSRSRVMQRGSGAVRVRRSRCLDASWTSARVVPHLQRTRRECRNCRLALTRSGAESGQPWKPPQPTRQP